LALAAVKFLMTGRELSIVRAELVFSALSSVPGGLEGVSEQTTFRKYVPSGNDCVSKA